MTRTETIDRLRLAGFEWHRRERTGSNKGACYTSPPFNCLIYNPHCCHGWMSIENAGAEGLLTGAVVLSIDDHFNLYFPSIVALAEAIR